MLSGISPVCCFLFWWERLVLGSMPVLSFYRNGGNDSFKQSCHKNLFKESVCKNVFGFFWISGEVPKDFHACEYLDSSNLD